MSRNSGIALFVLTVAALCVSITSLNMALRVVRLEEPDLQYVLFLGTNDKDTYEPVCTPEEAQQMVDKILSRYFDGFTIQEAMGGWADEYGRVTHEYTLVIYLSDTDIESVYAAAENLIREFNQTSVLIQSNQTRTEFYYAA